MKIENQCCTLEQAKRLKELGVEQNSYWEYANEVLKMSFTMNKGERYSAFTVAELGVMLPDQIRANSNIHYADLIIRNCGDEWSVGYDYDTSTEGGYGADIKSTYKIEYRKTEAEARAAILIHLLENNLITAEEVNKRLNE